MPGANLGSKKFLSLNRLSPGREFPSVIDAERSEPEDHDSFMHGNHKKLWRMTSSVPWVPETFLARLVASAYGRRRCRPSAHTENSRRTPEKPLVPRVLTCTNVRGTSVHRLPGYLVSWYQKNKSAMPSMRLSFIVGTLPHYHKRSRVFVEGHSKPRKN